VQDAAAALPARLLSDVCGFTVADLCAAPGGKTAQLAAAAGVVAVDRSRSRLSACGRTSRVSVGEIVAADAAQWQPAVRRGAARCAPRRPHHPPPSDIPWVKRKPTLPRWQRCNAGLCASCRAYEPVGCWSTACSLEPEEVDVVRDL
jgi:16S rRNA (cytosine967-C5)-methyltransferase